MTFRKRIEMLERATPQEHERLVIIRQIVSRQPNGELTESLHSALVVVGNSLPNKRLLRLPHEDEESFRERVLAEASGSTGS